ncbi:MAG TPA: SDR family oxidoreductase [Polyangia bacterium]|nr:SDR family oxidoreductase [Polyangia bacterium]
MSLNAIVTGASRGLGRALAVELARTGAQVVLVARESEELHAAVAEIRAAGGKAHAVAADVGDKEAIHQIAGAAAGLVGPIDLLVHNASTLGPTPLKLLLDTECEDFERVLQVNLVGPFRLSKAIAGGMALRGRGTIVHVSSDAATSAYPRWGAYGVSKAALDHLGRSWAAELGELGVRVLVVDPGEMDTAMHADAMPEADRTTLARPEAVAHRILVRIFEPAFENGARVAIGGGS